LSGPLSGRGYAPPYDQPRQPILPAIIVAAQPAIVVVATHYTADLSSGASVVFGTNVSYRSKQYHTEFNDDRMAADGYVMVDANVKYRHSDDRTSVNLWVRNLTNELVWAGSYAVATSRTIGGTLMPPRTYGVTLGYEF